MSLIENIDVKSKQISIVASFAVIYAIMRIVPSFPVVGAPGASFQWQIFWYQFMR